MFRTTCVLAAVLGFSGVAHAQNDVVSGRGVAGVASFTINAMSGAAGETPSGYVQFVMPEADGTGVVQHLCVAGTRAVIAGPIDTGSDIGHGFVFYVEDRTAAGQADLIQIEIVTYVPAACPSFAMIAPTALEAGDILVTDVSAPPPPPPAVTFESLSALAVKYVTASGAAGATGVANALASQLASAKSANERGNENATDGILGAFVSTVVHLDRFLTQAQIDELIAMAGQL